MNGARRIVTIALAVIAAGLLALAIQGGQWWTVGDPAIGTVAIGPMSGSRCAAGACETIGLGWLGGSADWARAGMATYAAGLCAGLLLLIAAAGLASRRVIRLVAGSGLVAVATAAVAGAAFFALYPGIAGSAVGRGAWLFAAGVILAAIAQLAMLKHRGAAPAA